MDAARQWWSKRYKNFILTREIGKNGNVHFHLIVICGRLTDIVFPPTANTTNIEYKTDFETFKYVRAKISWLKHLADAVNNYNQNLVFSSPTVRLLNEPDMESIMLTANKAHAIHKASIAATNKGISDIYSMVHYIFKVDKPDEMNMTSYNYCIRIDGITMRE